MTASLARRVRKAPEGNGIKWKPNPKRASKIDRVRIGLDARLQDSHYTALLEGRTGCFAHLMRLAMEFSNASSWREMITELLKHLAEKAGLDSLSKDLQRGCVMLCAKFDAANSFHFGLT